MLLLIVLNLGIYSKLITTGRALVMDRIVKKPQQQRLNYCVMYKYINYYSILLI